MLINPITVNPITIGAACEVATAAANVVGTALGAAAGAVATGAAIKTVGERTGFEPFAVVEDVAATAADTACNVVEDVVGGVACAIDDVFSFFGF